MTGRLRRLGRVGVGAACAMALVIADQASAPAQPQLRPPSSDPAALSLLERAATAAQVTPYRAVQSVTRWGDAGPTSLVATVTHSPGVGLIAEVSPTPGQRTSGPLLDPTTQEASLSVTGDEVALLQRHYSVHLVGADTVNGRSAQMVSVARAAGGVAAKFWLDRATGLMLRRELLDDQGRLTLLSSYLDLSVLRQAPRPTTGVPSIRPATGHPLDADAVSDLHEEGFVAKSQLGGYEMIDARLSGSGRNRLLHLTYCDGLTTVSVFEQSGRLATGKLTGWGRTRVGKATVWVADGMPARLTWSTGGRVFTVLGDAPGQSLRAVVHDLPTSTPHRSLLSRLAHGFERIGSWLNPFN